MKVERRFYKNGKLMEEEYCNERGLLHREGDLPAKIRYYRNGKIQLMMWYKNGKLHRDGDKPAEIYYYNYKLERISYYKNGKLHREGDKPAVIGYNKNGKVIRTIWYKYGVEVSEDFCKQDFSKLDPVKVGKSK